MGEPGKSARAPGDSAYMRGWSIGDTHLNGMVPHFFHFHNILDIIKWFWSERPKNHLTLNILVPDFDAWGFE